MEPKKLQLVIEPDERLHKKSLPFDFATMNARALAIAMANVMALHEGIGLAAPQVGLPLRLVIIDEATVAEYDKADTPDEPLFVMINPRVLCLSDKEVEAEEGCLSLPKMFADVVRPESIEIEYHDINGNVCRRKASGTMARCIQHELDHLEGKLFIDHLSPLKRSMIRSKLRKPRKE
ncbi:MAG: peptide deformylase [Alphaproteobacteria bacterium]|nr:peptide deformylase [Alphaproteobacteria bacterium]